MSTCKVQKSLSVGDVVGSGATFWGEELQQLKTSCGLALLLTSGSRHMPSSTLYHPQLAIHDQFFKPPCARRMCHPTLRVRAPST